MYADEDGIFLIKSYHCNKLVKKFWTLYFFYWLNILRVFLEAGESKKECRTHICSGR